MLQLKAIYKGQVLSSRRFMYYSLTKAKARYREEFNLKHKKLEWIVYRGGSVLY